MVDGKARLTEAQLLELYRHAPLTDLGRWAFGVTQRLHPEDYRTYVIDRNINYTNICTARCTFCAFKRNDPEASDAYTLNYAQIHEKIQELVSIGGTQILMQGGMNPALPIEYYEGLLRSIREKFPMIHIHAFSPPEFVEFSRFFKMPVAGNFAAFQGCWSGHRPRRRRRNLLRPCALAHRPRQMHRRRVARCHDRGPQTWHELLGHHAHRPHRNHCERPHRSSQCACVSGSDWALANAPGNYTAFITWTYQPDNTPLDKSRKWNPDLGQPYEFDNGRTVRLADANEYLRTLAALSRLYLDNIKNMQSSWVTMGPNIGQLAYSSSAARHGLRHDGRERRLRAARHNLSPGCRDDLPPHPRQRLDPPSRNQYYEVLTRHDGPDSPDLKPPSPAPSPTASTKSRPKTLRHTKTVGVSISAAQKWKLARRAIASSIGR